MSAINQTVAKHVAALRSEANLSLQELANRAGLSKAHVWSLEQGAGNPTLTTVAALARSLGVSLDYLIGTSTERPDLHPEALRIAIELDALLKARK
jgi:transcriptional regulator with XRE-family HTH domain